MKIAVIGSGIAGNVAAYHLARDHEVTVFEADRRMGGHTHTVAVEHEGRAYAIDTGFIVFNHRTYPNFIALLDELGVRWQDSDMSFSVQDAKTGLEYNGTTLNALFAQRSNLLRPTFYRMIRDILRFNREARALLQPNAPEMSLGEFLEREGYSRGFIDHFIVPMGAAIWSATPDSISRMPAGFFVRFFDNHGLLSVDDRPVWRVIRGGSQRYVEALVAGHLDRVRLDTPVESLRRQPGFVEIKARGQEPERFDHVFVACHSDQALRLLADPSAAEKEVLGAIGYQKNHAVLHTDATVMPRRRLAWAAWNYHLIDREQDRVAVTYNMNILQSIQAPVQFCVSLNHASAIDPGRILHEVEYSHPVFTPEAVAAQRRHREINGAAVNGPGRTWYCGAYWRYGFHEDGVVSALTALEHFRQDNPHAQRDLRRTG